MSRSKRRRRVPPRPNGEPRRRDRDVTELAVLPARDHHPPGDGDGQAQMLVGLIATGALDPYLGTLQGAIAQRHRDRLRTASNEAAARLRVGDRVVVTDGVRPLYLQGATGTVVGWANQTALVQLDTPTGRFTTGQVRFPPLALRRLPAG